MSDTPRTDSMEPYLQPYSDSMAVHVPTTFARQLERELNAVTKERDALKAEVEMLKGLIGAYLDNDGSRVRFDALKLSEVRDELNRELRAMKGEG